MSVQQIRQVECDRCGRVTDSTASGWIEVAKKYHNTDRAHTPQDLCPDCRDQFFRFMSGATVEQPKTWLGYQDAADHE